MEIRTFDDFLRYKDDEVINYLKKNPQKYIFDPNEDILKRIRYRYKEFAIISRFRGTDLISQREELFPETILNSTNYIKQKRKYIENTNFKIKTLDILNIILESVLKTLYEEDKYEILRPNRDRLDVVIWYPEVTIKNSFEMSHVMRDIYIKYTFIQYSSYPVLYDISFLRTSFTLPEIKWDYCFSHISQRPLSSSSWATSFCFGGDTLLNQAINLMKNSGITSSNQVYELFLNFNNYLTWESIEGKPYRYIKDIRPYSLEPLHITYNVTDINTMYKLIISSLDSFKYTFTSENGNIKISLTEESKQTIINFINKTVKQNTIFEKYFTYFYNENENSIKPLRKEAFKLPVLNNIKFKGNILKYNIIEEIEDIQLPELTFSINVLKEIILKLESNFTTYFIENHA
jgi:hypothetical protein